MTRLVNDVDAMEEFYVRVLVPPFVAAVVVTITSAIYGLFDALMGLLLLAFLVLTGVVLPLASRWLSREPARMVAALRGDTGALIVDGLLGAADLVALDADGRHRQRLLARAGELDAARRRLGVIEGVSDALGGLFAALAGLCILVLAIPLVTAGEVEGVFLAALPLAAIAAFEAVQPLSRSLQLLDTTRASARRLFEIVDTPPTVTDAIPSRRPPEQVVTTRPMATDPTPPAIDIRGLSFRYAPDEPWVLRDVDLHIGAGERVALVGPSGCGKSTLLALLLRFWDYEQGSIRVAGRELREMGQDVVRAGLAVVPQDVHLFDATIRDNLAVADGDASDAEMEAACRIAQLHDAIAALPAGYDTVVGENGVRLSGGERRRLAIARAILKGAPVVVLDEATADLDATTQAALWTALDPWLAGRTVLVMAHEPPNGARVGRVVELRPDRDRRDSRAGVPPDRHFMRHGSVGRDRVSPLQVAARPRGRPLLERTVRTCDVRSGSQGGHMATGTIKKLVSDRGFGFITAEDGKEYFFHRNELESSSDFDRLSGGEKVEFEIGQSPKGPQAQKVRLT